METMTVEQWAIRPLRKYAVFTGRAPRAEFWWFYLATFIVSAIVDAIDSAIGAGEVLGALFSLAILLPFIAVAVRRLHDIDWSGWWNVAPLVPLPGLFFLDSSSLNERISLSTLADPPGLIMIAFLVALLLLIVAWAMPGTKGANRFGPNPYGQAVEDDPAEGETLP